MLSSAEQRTQHSNHRVYTRSSSSLNINYSTSSPPPSSSSPSHLQKRQPRTMEEVWRNIHDNSPFYITHHMNHEPSLRSHRNTICILKDFLNRPLINPHETPTSLTMNQDSTTTSLPPPATLLSLNSEAGFDFLDNPDLLQPFEPLVTSASLGCLRKKRGQDSDGGSVDRRHKRMIKNRESAARSRARKQAYTNELEIEVAYLQAENARLKRQYDQLRMAAASELPKKKTLQRASTAPF